MSKYDVIDPRDNPDVISQPPPPRKPRKKRGQKVKATTLDEIGDSSMSRAPVGSGKRSPSAGENPVAQTPERSYEDKALNGNMDTQHDPYDDERMDDANRARVPAQAPVHQPVADHGDMAAAPGPANPRRNNLRVRFQTEAGIYTVPAISVLECRYGIMVLLPDDPDKASFTPAIDRTITVGVDKKDYFCYFPGTEFDMPDIQAKALVFLSAGEKKDKA